MDENFKSLHSNRTKTICAMTLEISKAGEYVTIKWDKVFKSGLSKFCGRQPLKNFKGYGSRPYSLKFLKAVFHKIYLVHY